MTLILKFIFMENRPKMRLSTQVRNGLCGGNKIERETKVS